MFESVLVSNDMHDINVITITGIPRAYLVVFLNPFLSTRVNTNKPITMAIGLNLAASSIICLPCFLTPNGRVERYINYFGFD